MTGPMRARALAALACWLAGCGDLYGLKEVQGSVAQVHLRVVGSLAAVRLPATPGEAPRLRVALVWAAPPLLNDSYCRFGPLSDAEAEVVRAGCPDEQRFMPERVEGSIAVEPGVPALLDVMTPPSADVMTAYASYGLAFGSLVVYDDRDGDGTLELRTPSSPPSPGPIDVVYGGSFISQTLPDQRLSYRHGNFDDAGFYPRVNCPDPPEGFSILQAGGHVGSSSMEDAATCAESTLSEAEVVIALQSPEVVGQLACSAGGSGDNAAVYSPPPDDEPDLTRRPWACSTLMSSELQKVELAVATPPGEPCKGITHYVLRGCRGTPDCIAAKWDRTADPPAWWPCTEPAP